MADTPDPQELARRYLDLWQQHLTQAATDPELSVTMGKFWQNLSAGMAPGFPGWQPIAANPDLTDTGAPNNEFSRSKSGFASGPTPNPAAPDDGDNDFDELLDRMAVLEKRLDALESKPRGSGKRAAKGSSERKS